MKKYLFYVNEDGSIQCLCADTNVGVIEPEACHIKVIEAESYESALSSYESCPVVKEKVRSIVCVDDHIHQMYYGWSG